MVKSAALYSGSSRKVTRSYEHGGGDPPPTPYSSPLMHRKSHRHVPQHNRPKIVACVRPSLTMLIRANVLFCTTLQV